MPTDPESDETGTAPSKQDKADEPWLPIRPLGTTYAMARSMMRDIPVVGPGIAAAQDEYDRVENLLLRELRGRLDAAGADKRDDADSPRAMLAGLLGQSVEQSAAQARDRLLLRLLQDLEPDEARILAALSDGTTYPVVHVIAKAAIGGVGARLLENVSTVGRSAGVALPDYVPIYLSRLRRTGLVTLGPERSEHSDGYELLGTEQLVRETQNAYQGNTRLLRRTLSLSPLGRDLWSHSVDD